MAIPSKEFLESEAGQALLAESLTAIDGLFREPRSRIAFSAAQLPTSWSASTDTGSVGAAALTPSRAAEIERQLHCEHSYGMVYEPTFEGERCRRCGHEKPYSWASLMPGKVEVTNLPYWRYTDKIYEFDGEKVMAVTDCKMCGMTVAEHERRKSGVSAGLRYGTACNGDLHYWPISRQVPIEQDDPGDADPFYAYSVAALQSAIDGVDRGFLWDPKTASWSVVELADFTTGPLISRARLRADVDMRGCYGTPAADNVAPLLCPQAERKPPERLTDLEVDGSIGKAMRDIMKQEGRQPPEWLDADKEAKSG